MKWPFLLCRDAGQTGGATVVERCSYRRPRFLEEKREMAEKVVALKEMYSEEEVRMMYGFKISGDGYAKVTCGCPSYCYDDVVDALRVFANADLEISSDCTPGCQCLSFFFVILTRT
ncbi:putative developmental regulator, ULTRAPETALA [Helianthus annuus]|nr:putative developmental regulator, ULTRAPETALA [Helianthus annuus]